MYTIGAGIKALVALLVSTVSKEDALFAYEFQFVFNIVS